MVTEPPAGKFKNKYKEQANDPNKTAVAIQPEACPNFLPNNAFIKNPNKGNNGINKVGKYRFDVCIIVCVIFFLSFLPLAASFWHFY